MQYGLARNGSGLLKHEIHGLYKTRNGGASSFFLILRLRACGGCRVLAASQEEPMATANPGRQAATNERANPCGGPACGVWRRESQRGTRKTIEMPRSRFVQEV